jgi:hypothetical protein
MVGLWLSHGVVVELSVQLVCNCAKNSIRILTLIRFSRDKVSHNDSKHVQFVPEVIDFPVIHLRSTLAARLLPTTRNLPRDEAEGATPGFSA